MMVNRDPFYYIIPCFVLLVAPHHKFLFVSLFFGTRNFVLTNKKIKISYFVFNRRIRPLECNKNDEDIEDLDEDVYRTS